MRSEDDPSSWDIPRGWTVRYVPVTGSTSDDAKQAAVGGCPERTVFLADEQVAGRGRLGRQWIAPPRSSLLFSIVLRRDFAPVHLTATVALSVAAAIEQVTALPARIKWPNDVMVRDRKACGILTEVVSSERENITIVGVGLNVNLDPPAAGLPPSATALSWECGASVSREVLLRSVLEHLDAWLSQSHGELAALVQREWEARLWRRHQQVRVDDSGKMVEGIVEGLSSSGALRIQRPDGTLVEVTVGDIVIGAH